MSELPSRPNPSHESSTGARFSFANSESARRLSLEDYTIGSYAQQTRLIRYQGGRDEPLRHRLETAGLILGERIGDNPVYRVPRSSRPLAYEASNKSDGLFSYTDEQLLYDLGVLLGKVAAIDGPEANLWQMVDLETPQNLGQLVAIVDFTLPHEGNLFLRPGAEEDITPVPKHATPDPALLYSPHIVGLFGEHAEGGSSVYFRMGFNEQLGAPQDETA